VCCNQALTGDLVVILPQFVPQLFAELSEALASTESAHLACTQGVGIDVVTDHVDGTHNSTTSHVQKAADCLATPSTVGPAAGQQPDSALAVAAAVAACSDDHGQQQSPAYQQLLLLGDHAAPHQAQNTLPTPATAQATKQQRKQLTMHPANLYAAGEPDFAALAAAHPPLARHLIYPAARASSSSSTARPSIDFTSWEATKELTAALLKVDFGVSWDLPAGQLVPPVPNRANYVHWIADLLQLSSPPGKRDDMQARLNTGLSCPRGPPPDAVLVHMSSRLEIQNQSRTPRKLPAAAVLATRCVLASMAHEQASKHQVRDTKHSRGGFPARGIHTPRQTTHTVCVSKHALRPCKQGSSKRRVCVWLCDPHMPL